MNRRLLPEWSCVRAVLIAWPHTQGDWGETYAEVSACYQKILTAFAREVETWVLVHPCVEEAFNAFHRSLETNNVRAIGLAYDDTWVRDYGPVSLSDGFMNFTFNGWGNKFDAECDNGINEQLREHLGRLHSSELVVEGGALEINDSGILLANRDCLLDKKRNPQCSDQKLLYELASALGVREFALIENVHLSGDDTDGHIDTLARFVSDDHIVYCGDNPEHPDRESLHSLERQLQALADKYAWRLTALPTPALRDARSGRALAASYANFLICNQVVFLPVYDVPQDQNALEIFKDIFPAHRIVPVSSRALLAQNGSLHCASMQLAEAAWQ